MAVEIVRQVWCDIHLKAKKKKVSGVEGRASAFSEGQMLSIDLCDECFATLTWAQILEYGSAQDQPKLDKNRLSDRIRQPPKQGGRRALVECSFCGKQMTNGAGWALHNKVHERNNETANPIPVAS